MGKSQSFPRVVIVGAGVAGRELVQELKRNRVPVTLVGFVDDDAAKQDSRIARLPVLGSSKQLSGLLKKQHVDEVYIAIPSAAGEDIQKILDSIGEAPVRIRIIPRWLDIVQGRIDLPALRSIQPEDLLGRPLRKMDQRTLVRTFHGARIFVSGGAGSIGSELVRQLLVFQPGKVVVYDWWENGLYMLQREVESRFPRAETTWVLGNMQDQNSIKRVIRRTKPTIVFHASAYKHVPMLEDFPIEAVKNNLFATKIILDVARDAGVATFVLLSTDKAVQPKSVMGQTKKLAEHVVLQNRGRMKTAVVRFGNVLESFGSIVPLFRQQIASGGPVTVTDTAMTRYFMTIPEAVQLILHASVMIRRREIFVLDVGKPINVLSLTKRAIRLLGYTPGRDIKIKMTRPRPGEKQREELFSAEEKIVKTGAAGVFRTHLQGEINIAECIEVLERAVKDGNDTVVRRALSNYAAAN